MTMSAGEFFDLIRPVAIVLSALLSTWVLASARRSGFRFHSAIAWALATLFLPVATFPLYLAVRLLRGKRRRANETALKTASRVRIRWRFLAPLAYATIVLSLVGLYLYRDYENVDAVLARAAQARVTGNQERVISEYLAALALEDNPHTHKLLGIELKQNGEWTEALSEFRLAERGGEDDQSLPLRIAQLLDLLNLPNQGTMEYRRFLHSEACEQGQPDYRCEAVRQRVEATSRSLR